MICLLRLALLLISTFSFGTEESDKDTDDEDTSIELYKDVDALSEQDSSEEDDDGSGTDSDRRLSHGISEGQELSAVLKDHCLNNLMIELARLQESDSRQSSYVGRESLKLAERALSDAIALRMRHDGTNLPQESLSYPHYDNSVSQAPELVGLCRQIGEIGGKARMPSQSGWRSWTIIPFCRPSLSKKNAFVLPEDLYISFEYEKIEQILDMVIAQDHDVQSLRGTDPYIDTIVSPPLCGRRLPILLPELYEKMCSYCRVSESNKLEEHCKNFLTTAPYKAIRDHSKNLKLEIKALQLIIQGTHSYLKKLLQKDSVNLNQLSNDLKSGNTTLSMLQATKLVSEYLHWHMNLYYAKYIIDKATYECEFNYECQQINRIALTNMNTASIKKIKQVLNKLAPAFFVLGVACAMINRAYQQGLPEQQYIKNCQFSMAQQAAMDQYASSCAILTKPSLGVSREIIQERIAALNATIHQGGSAVIPAMPMPQSLETLGLSIREVAATPGTILINQLYKENIQIIEKLTKAYRIITDARVHEMLKRVSGISRDAIAAGRRGDIVQAAELTNKASACMSAFYQLLSGNKEKIVLGGVVLGVMAAPQAASIFAAYAVGEGAAALFVPAALEIAQCIGISAIFGTQFVSQEQAHQDAQEYLHDLLRDKGRSDDDKPAQDTVAEKKKVEQLPPHKQRELEKTIVAAGGGGLPPLDPRDPRNKLKNNSDQKNNNETKITSKQATEAAEQLGFSKTNVYVKNQPVFKKGNLYITPDIDSHNGGFWKLADSIEKLKSKPTRLGTYDRFLNRIGD